MSGRAPGMAAQALAGEIVAALRNDGPLGGYDLEAGLFGPAFSALVRRWAEAEWQALTAAPANAPHLILVGYWHTHAKLREAEFSKTPLQEADRRDGWVEQALYTKAGAA